MNMNEPRRTSREELLRGDAPTDAPKMVSRAEILAAALRRQHNPAPASAVPERQRGEPKMRGVVSMISGARTFGFLKPDAPSAQDAFINGTVIRHLGLQVGDKVAYDMTLNPGRSDRFIAVNVSVIARSGEAVQ